MCRLLGVVSAAPGNLAEQLGADLDRFAGLSQTHCDGWGMAYWNAEDDLVTAKYPEPAQGSRRFRAAAEAARTDAALLHLRKASKNMANVMDNTHPFHAGDVAFAHNGYLTPLSALDELVRERGGRPSVGATDSERYFNLVLAGLGGDGVVQALHEAAELIIDAAEVVSLNCLLLTRDALYASARYDEKVILARGEELELYELRYRVTPDHVAVASSGWPQPAPWAPLRNGEILEVRRHDLRTSVHSLR
ncbi:class II glutamine amidotransferase [Jatrophihabitans sp.]|uniref:class II glutamine amidotransferase n=1 Tax=Jatrophihabitans sp. TaxID=1932789 RepID=UPI002EEE6F2B